MKKALFTLIMMFLSMTLMAQSSHHKHKSSTKSTPTYYYVQLKAFTNYSSAQNFTARIRNNNGRFSIRTVKANGKTFYIVGDFNKAYTNKWDAREASSDLGNIYGYLFDDEEEIGVWASKVKTNTETVNRKICDCEECYNGFLTMGRCRHKGRWIIIAEGGLAFRCDACDYWYDGCDYGCTCR